MKIENIKINHFGNLENRDIYLGEGFNVVYGKNESGKSTMLNYIKSMLYGISKKKNGKELSDYDKYNPWMKGDFSGKLKYQLDNGKIFEIFRDFKNKDLKIYNENLEEISKEFNIDKKEGVQFFYDQTKVDEIMFISTIVSMQQRVKIDRENQNIILQKIANLAGTGDDNISFKMALDKLNKKQVEQIGTDRTQEKPLNIIKRRMKELSLIIKDKKIAQEEKEKIQKEKDDILKRIHELETKNNIYAKINELNIKKSIEDEKINLKNKSKNENKRKIEELNTEKNKFINEQKKIDLRNENCSYVEKRRARNNGKIKQKHYLIRFVIIILFSVLLKVINIYSIKNALLDYFVYGMLVVSVFYFLISILKRNRKIKEEQLQEELEKKKLELEQEKNKNEKIRIEQQIENINEQIKNYQEEVSKQESEINQLQENIDQKIDITIENIKLENTFIDIDALLEMIDFKNVKSELSVIQNELNNARITLNTLEIQEKEILLKLEDMITLEEEQSALEEKLRELELQSEYISLTKNYLNKAYEKMKNMMTPKFTENLSRNVANISNGKYTKVTINDEEGIIVENQYGEYVSANYLSIGTIDQLYLSLRLSMIDELSNESMPIILDEAFAYYDDERLFNIIKFLVNQQEKNQIILFTCTKREQEILNKAGFQYNLVEL